MLGTRYSFYGITLIMPSGIPFQFGAALKWPCAPLRPAATLRQPRGGSASSMRPSRIPAASSSVRLTASITALITALITAWKQGRWGRRPGIGVPMGSHAPRRGSSPAPEGPAAESLCPRDDDGCHGGRDRGSARPVQRWSPGARFAAAARQPNRCHPAAPARPSLISASLRTGLRGARSLAPPASIYRKQPIRSRCVEGRCRQVCGHQDC
jgi:hypothetical protein